MKNKILILFSIFILQFINIEAQKTSNCLLWEISGNGLSNSSYIYGTIHLIPQEKFFFYDKWQNKFKECKVLVLETDTDLNLFKQLSILKKVKLPKNKDLSDYMSKSEYQSMQSYLIDSLHISESTFNICLKLKPFFSYALILNEAIPGKKVAYEQYFTKEASKNKMRLATLETIDFQLSLVDSISIEDQIKEFLYDHSKTEQTDILKTYLESVEYYIHQDLTNLSEMSSESDLESGTEFLNNFLINRNKDWIGKIEKIINHKPTFIAVGAAHLPGKNGVLNLLRQKGYTLKPVFQ